MRLSLYIITHDAEQYIEPLLRGARTYADEIVVAVDETSSDATLEICRWYADKLFSIQSPMIAARALAWLHAQCTGDWVLRLDDDELPSAGLINALPRLMEDREITSYHLRVRWVIGEQHESWIAARPWWPEWQPRLFRNIPSLIHVPGTLHTLYSVTGASRYLTDASFYHYDLVYHNEAYRREKIARREMIQRGGSLAHYYIPDVATLHTLPIPADDPPYHAAGPRRAIPFPPDTIRHVSLVEIHAANLQDVTDRPEVFQAGLTIHECPAEMIADAYILVEVELRNDSPVAWPYGGLGHPTVSLSYHWLYDNGETYEADGFRTPLPCTLLSGEQMLLPATVHAPAEPGTYILQWDLVIEHTAWFSWRGWHGLEHEVQVIKGAS